MTNSNLNCETVKLQIETKIFLIMWAFKADMKYITSRSLAKQFQKEEVPKKQNY